MSPEDFNKELIKINKLFTICRGDDISKVIDKRKNCLRRILEKCSDENLKDIFNHSSIFVQKLIVEEVHCRTMQKIVEEDKRK